jgi:hypothetical protein
MHYSPVTQKTLASPYHDSIHHPFLIRSYFDRGSHGYSQLEIPVAAVNPLISRDRAGGGCIFEQQECELIETWCRSGKAVGFLIEYVVLETQGKLIQSLHLAYQGSVGCCVEGDIRQPNLDNIVRILVFMVANTNDHLF